MLIAAILFLLASLAASLDSGHQPGFDDPQPGECFMAGDRLFCIPDETRDTSPAGGDG